jgi:hypothetical protein
MRTQFVAMIGSTLVGILALSGPALSQQKTAKQCQDEWQANKAGYQSLNVTEKTYIDKCRAGQPIPLPPAPAPTAAAPAAKPAPTPVAAPVNKPATTATTAPTEANEFSTEAQAKARCPTDTVVWANLKSKIFHFGGHKDYGATKEGAYMCEKDATAQGIRAAKNEKHP